MSALRTFRRNAIMSERSNQQKAAYYQLDITIGKLSLLNHPLFSEEERNYAQLKKLLKEYKERADLALIPHFIETKQILTEEMNRMRKVGMGINAPQLELLENELKRNEDKLNKEVYFMQELMNAIYSKWADIKKIRDNNGFISTPGKLRVRSYDIPPEGLKEMEFLLDQIDINKDDIPKDRRNEITRRNNVQKQRIFIRLLVNHKYVTRTKKAFINWPSFEADFQEKYQLYLYAKPSSIQLQIVTGLIFPKTIDTIDVPIPGDNVNTLTSSSSIYQEMSFFKKIIEKPVEQVPEKKKVIEKNKKNEDNEDAASLLKQSKEAPENEVQKFIEKLSEIKPFEGRVLYKGQWIGYGPHMPPRNIDYFQKKLPIEEGGANKIPKGLLEYETNKLAFGEPGFHIDVNDPRNELLFETLRHMKSRELRELLKQEEMLPFFDLISLRQRLLKMRYANPDLMELEIPMTEDEIFFNKRLIELLEVKKFVKK